MFSSEFCEIFKNIFFTEDLWVAASVALIPMTQIATKIKIAICHLQWRIQNPFKHLRWSVLRKELTAFSRSLFWQNAPS